MNKKLLPAAAAFLLGIGTASAVDPPEMKEGLWSIHRQTVDNPGNKKVESTSTICRSHAYDQHVESLAKSVKGCTPTSQSFQGGKYSSASHCVVGGTVIESRGTATYQGDTSAHSETHATYSPAMDGVSETTMVMDQKYVGSCPAGVQPGDMTSADGRITHLWKH
jgi:hypothetical protein